jgi:hypothetical protein
MGTVAPSQWLRVETAAELLDTTRAALRKRLERNALRAPDGAVEASFDGVRGRKLGRTWRVQLSSRWLAEGR